MEPDYMYKVTLSYNLQSGTKQKDTMDERAVYILINKDTTDKRYQILDIRYRMPDAGLVLSRMSDSKGVSKHAGCQLSVVSCQMPDFRKG